MRGYERGATWLEVTSGLSLGAIVLIVAIPVFRREVRGSHQAEARAALLRIARAAEEYARSPKHPRVLPGAVAQTPSDVPRGTAVIVPDAAWEAWRELGIRVIPEGAPQRYAYSFARTSGEPAAFEAVAVGDLDGDGAFSRAVLRGTLDASGTVQYAHEVEFIDALE